MPRESALKNYFTFAGGVITEASPLNYPENSSQDESNFRLLRNGSRRRRQGIDYESGYVLSDSIDKDTISEKAVSIHIWEAVNGISTLNYLIVQIGNILYFYNYNNSTVSSEQYDYFLDLENFKAPSATFVGQEPIQTANGNGKIFIASKEIDTFFIYQNQDTDFLETEIVDISFRDFEGVDDGFAANYRPTSEEYNGAHEYNLLNQGWSKTHINTYVTAQGVLPSNSDIWYYGRNATDVFTPAELDKQEFGNTLAPKGRNILNLFKQVRQSVYDFKYLDISLIGAELLDIGDIYLTGINVTTTEPHLLETGDLITLSGIPYIYMQRFRGAGSTWYNIATLYNDKIHVAVKISSTVFGIRNISYKDYIIIASSASGAKVRTRDKDTTTVATRNISTRPSSIAFWAGRAWYAGVEDEKYSSSLFFSQLILNNNQIGRCYQEQDPTSEHLNDLLATDGGVVPIPELGKVIRLIAMSDSLLIFASNGVWQIRGGETDVFKATDYYVRKVTDIGALSPFSIIQADGTIFYWANGGIFALTTDQVTNNLVAQNISENTIQSRYNAISEASKINSRAAYDDSQKKIFWTYNSDPTYAGGININKYDSILIFDASLPAFYFYNIKELASDSPFMSTPFITSKVRISEIDVNVVVDDDVVTVSGDTVTAGIPAVVSGETKLKMLVFVPDTGLNTVKYTFAEFNNSSFKDWETADSVGIDASGYIETGFELAGDGVRDKQIDKFYTFLNKTETGFVDDGAGNLILENPSGCTGQIKWNWSDHPNSGKESSTFECYKLPPYVPSGVGDPLDNGVPVIVTSHNIKGQGKAYQVRFDTVAGKDCWLLGWSAQISMSGVG